MKNPFKIVTEKSLLQWLWSEKKGQVISMLLLALMIAQAAAFSDMGIVIKTIVIVGAAVWAFLTAFLHPALIYRDLRKNYYAFEKSFNPQEKRIILSGAAGSGKDYLRNHLAEYGFKFDVSWTTRPQRAGEKLGYTYNYVSPTNFIELNSLGHFHECVEFNGAFYGTSKASWATSKLFIMTPSGVAQLSKEDLAESIIVYLNIDEDIRRGRMEKRSDSGFDKIERRIAADKKDFEGFEEVANITINNSRFDVNRTRKLLIELTRV